MKSLACGLQEFVGLTPDRLDLMWSCTSKHLSCPVMTSRAFRSVLHTLLFRLCGVFKG
jgi:hypothetical protein